MNLRRLFMETKNAPRACFVWSLLLILALGLSTWDGARYDIKTDGPMLKIPGKATLRQQFEKDTLTTALHRGDSVRLIGIDRSSFGQKYLVETSRGDIGWIDASDLTNIPQIITDGQDKGDTVAIEAVWLSRMIHNYKYTSRDGEERKRTTSGFMPVLEGWEKYAYNSDGIAGISSRRKFESRTIGRSYEEIAKQFGRPVLLRHTRDGFIARYAWKTYDPENGSMWRPNVAFSKDSTATSVSYGHRTTRAAGYLKKMPLSAQIMDLHATTVLMRSSRYDLFADPMPATWVKVLLYGLIALSLLWFLLWLFAMPALPALVLGWVIAFPKPLAWLSDKWLRRVMFVISLAAWYIWSIMTMAWGMFAFWIFVGLIVNFYLFRLASADLCTYPHNRCPQCRRMYTIRFDREELEYSEIKTGSDIVKGQLLGHRTSKWDTWTQVTTTRITTNADGSTSSSSSSHRENLKHHTQHYRTYEMIDYRVTYRLDHYRQYWICSECGLVEETTSVAWVEIDRQETGRHTSEFTEEHEEE